MNVANKNQGTQEAHSSQQAEPKPGKGQSFVAHARIINGNTGARVVASVQAIPLIFEAHFCNTLINSGSPQTPVYTSWTNSLTPLGGTSLFNETFPTIANYQVWMANVKAIQAANGNPWTGLVWDGGAASAPYLDQNQSLITQFIIKDSDLKQFSGNIWERITTYALAV